MLLLTNCEVHKANEIRSLQKAKSKNFPCGMNKWTIRALLYIQHERFGKFSENLGEVDAILDMWGYSNNLCFKSQKTVDFKKLISDLFQAGSTLVERKSLKRKTRLSG